MYTSNVKSTLNEHVGFAYWIRPKGPGSGASTPVVNAVPVPETQRTETEVE